MEITNQLLAAYAEGNVTEAERSAVRQYLTEHPEELESVMIMMDRDYDIQLRERHHSDHSRGFDIELDDLLNEIDSSDSDSLKPTSANVIPILSKAARNNEDNLCAIKCEGYALRALGIEVTDEELEQEAKEGGLIKPEGTPLHRIGLLSEKYGLFAARKYNCTINDIILALEKGEIVIAAIDRTELDQTFEEAESNDKAKGKIPNHALVIQSIDINNGTIDLVEPGISMLPQTYPLDVFQNAWNDSANYLVILSNQCNYEPHPLNLDDVPIEPELLELREAIAENAHEVWAKTRKDEGWSYGPVRDDIQKKNPDMLPYNLLPESEKEYDRLMAMNTIKLVKKLGWELLKRR